MDSVGRVLVIEDEETLRSNVVRALSKLERVSVVGAGTLGEAVALIDERAPDIVLSDLDLPDRPGVEIIGELGRRQIRCPVVFVSAYTRAFSAQIPRHANVRVIDKPVPLEKLRNIVREHFDSLAAGDSKEQGAPFGVADYLQLACLGQHSVMIQIQGESPPAKVIVHRGVLWNAIDRYGQGEDAFRRLALARGPEVNVRSLQEDPGPRHIHSSWEALLIDVARDHDERSQGAFSDALATGQTLCLAEATPDVEFDLAEPAETAPGPEEQFERAYEEGVGALLEKNYAAAFRAFRQAEALMPDDRKVAANLKRLRDLGVTEDGSQGG